jgi:hypothetical protein
MKSGDAVAPDNTHATNIVSSMIEIQEKVGQNILCKEEVLPKECPKEQLKSLGFVFGKSADKLFIACKFPEGWSKRPTDHSMWSDLVDSKGRIRGNIFYKAAFYDESAFMRLCRRFRCIVEPQESCKSNIEKKDKEQKVWVGRVYDHDNKVIHEIKMNKDSSDDDVDSRIKVSQKLDKKIREWLADNYPDWENVMAYWD